MGEKESGAAVGRLRGCFETAVCRQGLVLAGWRQSVGRLAHRVGPGTGVQSGEQARAKNERRRERQEDACWATLHGPDSIITIVAASGALYGLDG